MNVFFTYDTTNGHGKKLIYPTHVNIWCLWFLARHWYDDYVKQDINDKSPT